MPDINSIFEGYTKEAFRLETIYEYCVPGEWENFQAFLKNGQASADANLIKYMKDASLKIESGKRHLRARLIPSPPNKYIEFETLVGYIPQSKIGFEHLILESMDIESIKLGRVLVDFWLFDKKELLIMDYKSNGTFKSITQEKDQNLVNKAKKIRDYCIEKGRTLSYLRDMLKV